MKKLYQEALDDLLTKNQYRTIPKLLHQGQWVKVEETVNTQSSNTQPTLINIASNDYLAIGVDSELQAEFFDYLYQLPKEQRPKFGSTSSRLLTGNDKQLQLLEESLADWYGQGYSTQSQLSALVFNSGYHSNLGILPAIAVLPSQSANTLILADKLVHASMIDGIRLATMNNRCRYKRYRHNDHGHLRRLIQQTTDSGDNGDNIERIIIVTESVFSMDGDVADLNDLVRIKAMDKRIEIYLDEAHAVGVMGNSGLGLAEQTGTLEEIDYLVGTFGKAFASMGAYLICQPVVRDWLINSMRPLIYSTALPPMTHAWSRFVLQKMSNWHDKRTYLQSISTQLQQAIEEKTGQINPSQSPIVPYILGANDKAIDKAKQLQQAGFYALPIRPPTVPANTARIRLVMNAGLSEAVCERLINSL